MQKFVTLVITICSTIVFVYLFSALWQYRVMLAVVIFITIYVGMVTWIAIIARATLIEQVVRLQRYKYREEVPLGYTPPMPLKRASRQYFEDEE